MRPDNESHPVVNIKENGIVKIGIVVRDAVKMAKRYTEIFGIGPWVFFDVTSADAIYREAPIDGGEFCLRCAMASLGKRKIELVQPLYGQSSHRDFLESCGEGIHHVGFGGIRDHDQFVSTLKSHGIALEMSGSINGADTFSYMATQDVLGTIFEVTAPIDAGPIEKLKPWGSYSALTPGVINLDGKQINQLGIVVGDVEKTAAAYWKLCGIGPWVFMDVKMKDKGGLFKGVPHTDPETYIKIATADFNDLQFELLQPVSGTSSHMDFLKTRGQGIHHVSFGDAKDHDDIVDAMEKEGIGIEMSGILGNAITFTYFASQKDLGTIYEVLKIDPDLEITLVPTGIYPPQ